MQTRNIVIALLTGLLSQVAIGQGKPPQDVNVINTPDVNVANTPDVNVANTPDVNVASMPDVNVASMPDVNVANTPNVNVVNTLGVNVLNTSIPVTVESAPPQPLTSHLGVPIENFAGKLFNNFGGVGTNIPFGPARSAISGAVGNPVQPGFDWVVTDIDYDLSARVSGICDPADEGKRITLTIAVGSPAIRNYFLDGKLGDDCRFVGRDYMTAGFVVGAGEALAGGASCPTCNGAADAQLQLRGYVVARPSP